MRILAREMDMVMEYDIIGDVHGHADKLEALLLNMGYEHRAGAWRHPVKTAVFVGDFVDRGPRQVDTVNLVRNMVEAGSALAVMGNHELNAIGWITPSERNPGLHLRRRDGKKGQSNRFHHKEFLSQVGEDSREHQSMVDWFLQLPLWLDLPDLKVAHACWHADAMTVVRSRLGAAGHLDRSLLEEALWESGSEREPGQLGLFDAVELICKGVEIVLPEGMSYKDQDGFERTRVRSRWWDQSASTFRACALLRNDLKMGIPDSPIPESAKVVLPTDAPVFFGHYWMSGTPAPVGRLAACVDYSAAKNGPLVAYRYEGEPELTASKFASSAVPFEHGSKPMPKI